MQYPLLSFPEVVNKTVESLRVYTNSPTGREVHICFSDGTALSIEIDGRTVVSGKFYRNHQGDIEVIEERTDLDVSAN